MLQTLNFATWGFGGCAPKQGFYDSDFGMSAQSNAERSRRSPCTPHKTFVLLYQECEA